MWEDPNKIPGEEPVFKKKRPYRTRTIPEGMISTKSTPSRKERRATVALARKAKKQ